VYVDLVRLLDRFLPVEVAAGVAGLLFGVALLIAVALIDSVLGGRLRAFGIRPRRLIGLVGVAAAPLLHGSLGHLALNVPPLLLLGAGVSISGPETTMNTTAIAWVVSGLGAWLFGGKRTVHIGASGVVFGYLGFIFGRALFDQSGTALLVAVGAGVLYSGAIWGLMPLQRGRSWQGHLFGLAGGLLAAWMLYEG
jgi:membrane associated rhomboid family serine protease